MSEYTDFVRILLFMGRNGVPGKHLFQTVYILLIGLGEGQLLFAASLGHRYSYHN